MGASDGVEKGSMSHMISGNSLGLKGESRVSVLLAVGLDTTHSIASQTCFLNMILASSLSSGKRRTLTQNVWVLEGRLNRARSWTIQRVERG